MVDRTILASLVLVAALAWTVPALASEDADVEDAGLIGQAGGALAGITGPVEHIVAPTSGAPAFVLEGATLTVELDRLPQEPFEDPLNEVHLVPSFGDGDPIVLEVDNVPDEQRASGLWEGPYEREVFKVPLKVPEDALADRGAKQLFDVVVPGFDEQPRAVSVYEAWPQTPEIVIVADPSTTDPRALGDGIEQSTGLDPLAVPPGSPEDVRADPDLEAFNTALNRTLGVDVLGLNADLEDRWRAYQDAIAQINEKAPDLVLFTGDLTFGWGPDTYRAEYEEAWALLNGGPNAYGATYEGLRVPTVLAPGNHDGYAQFGTDGLEYWEAYFGPPAFATSFSNVTIVSLNTYDWTELDRVGVSYAVSAWGGQVREDQLAWLRGTLCQAQGGTVVPDASAIADTACEGVPEDPEGRIVTFAHHSPSWEQDRFNETTQQGLPWGDLADQARGVPVLEQIARGVVAYSTTGQAWSGEHRLETRQTLREFGVDVHFAGHTHEDRVARDTGDGSIVETPQHPRAGLDVTKLHLVHPDNTAEVPDQDQARAWLLGEEPRGDAQEPGPVYIDTTTTAAETALYFGTRGVTWHESPAAFDDADARGIPPFETGHAMPAWMLECVANDPDRWNADHAELGLFSTPTYPPKDPSAC